MATEADWAHMNERVSRLEKRQRLTTLAMVVLGAPMAVGLSARAAPNTRSPAAVPRLEAEELIITDKAGHMRAWLGTSESIWSDSHSSGAIGGSLGANTQHTGSPCYKGRGEGLETSLKLFDSDGTEKAVMQVAGNCTPSVSLHDRESTAIAMGVDAIGQPTVYFWNRGDQRLSLSGGAHGAGLNLGVAGVSRGAISLGTGLDGTAHVNLYDASGLRAALGDTRYAMKGGMPVQIEDRSSASLVLFDEKGRPQFKAP